METALKWGVASTIDTHPQKQRIIDGLLAGETLRKIAESVSPPVSLAAVFRFRKTIVLPAVKQSFTALKRLNQIRDECVTENTSAEISARTYNTRPDAELNRENQRNAIVSPFLTRIAKKYDRYDKLLDKAVSAEDPDIKAIAALDAAETRSMDFHARLVGAIAPAATEQQQGISLTIVLPRPGEHQRVSASSDCIDITAEPAE